MSAPDSATGVIRIRIDDLYRSESRRVLATLIRLIGDFDAAEEALHDAFATAIVRWPVDGVPANPRAWLISTGRFQAIDRFRRQARFDASASRIADEIEQRNQHEPLDDDNVIADDRLRLIFTCCHPALSPDARIALTLREVCGLTTEAIASAFFTSAPTVAQRIVRAKEKIRAAGIPYQVPIAADIATRLQVVLHVIYLVFNEGYAASHGTALLRPDLSSEAIRLARIVVQLLPEPEAMGLLALMLLHDARKDTRSNGDGSLILLDQQDRSRWDQAQITEGQWLVETALRSQQFGAYTLQAAIAALHAGAATAGDTDWAEICGLYDLLQEIAPSPVIALNRAVAIAMRDTPTAGLMLIDQLIDSGELDDYRLAHAAQGDLRRRNGDIAGAITSYERALDLTRQGAERQFIEGRLSELRTRLPRQAPSA